MISRNGLRKFPLLFVFLLGSGSPLASVEIKSLTLIPFSQKQPAHHIKNHNLPINISSSYGY